MITRSTICSRTLSPRAVPRNVAAASLIGIVPRHVLGGDPILLTTDAVARLSPELLKLIGGTVPQYRTPLHSAQRNTESPLRKRPDNVVCRG